MVALGDRMKSYERVADQHLTRNSCAFVRVDGKAFHTWTKQEPLRLARGVGLPFHTNIHGAMTYATTETAKQMQGFKLAYTQSDESTFMMADFDTVETEGWFGYRVNKIVSITASLFTYHFNYFMQQECGYENLKPAIFDARAFVIPTQDAPNMFVWRQQDWERNSVQMLGHHYFSTKKMHQKNRSDVHEMLHGIGVNWATDLEEWMKNGTFITKNLTPFCQKIGYDDIWTLSGLDEIV